MDSVQFKDSSGFLYVSTDNPLPVIVSTPSGDQPVRWEWSDVSTTTPLPITATISS
jgi:hypothetical protein